MVLRINSDPNISTAFNPGHKVANQIDKLCMVWSFLSVMLQFHLNVMYIKFYVILFVI